MADPPPFFFLSRFRGRKTRLSKIKRPFRRGQAVNSLYGLCT
ncbi:hypothetical protein CHCC20348_4199 [Bacillus paralicheniformis]|uniref:Uncharacterized protein n=1 Tax=Bacillus paralicheniformis TaxID=1648923 RepID=A0ABY3G0Q9_9BACI|nr:hypothetical protein CHCC20348_4199 [Bacillus paralicheniformis]TWL41754.1 hypothetical protein CHCC15381_3923 [Bacillus paralicheniformis]